MSRACSTSSQLPDFTGQHEIECIQKTPDMSRTKHTLRRSRMDEYESIIDS
jgi:hypothetical protein